MLKIQCVVFERHVFEYRSATATATRAAGSGHYFKITTGALSPAAEAANSKQQQPQQQQILE